MVFWTEQESGSKLLPRGSKGNFLGAAMAAAQMSFPGCHRVWHTEEKRLMIASDVRSLQVKLDHDVVSLPRPAIKAPRSVRRRTMSKALDQEAERGVPSNLGRVSSPFRHAESGAGGISGVSAATSPTKTVSPIHEPANPLGHVRGDTAQVDLLDTLSV